MVLFPNDTLTLYSRGTAVVNGEGIETGYTYALYKSVTADCQPVGSEQVVLLVRGLSNLQVDDRIAFVNVDVGIAPIMKVWSARYSTWYELVQVAPWGSHYFLLLKPFQAGQVPT